MRTLDLHRDVGAYALGVLDASDAFRFEDHLMVCPQCTLLLADFGGVKAQLDQYARQTPAEVAPYAVASPELLTGLLDRTAAGRRRNRRRRFVLAAAAAVLMVGGPLAVLGAAPPDRQDPAVPGTVRWTASDGATGTSAVVTTAETDWGTDVGLELVRPGASDVCALVAVGRDGSKETVMTWASHTRDGGRLVTRGGAALRPGEIARFEVRASDGRLVVAIAE
ncbi:zf-HC2 domain-containing protein [Streptomyces sp. NPDC093109]|uniref:zf-HC2 domain-containing protein n=1 Tax=Streptomyces sp. NPDC093109 TaxID=3154977 RepID=UPI00344E40DA